MKYNKITVLYVSFIKICIAQISVFLCALLHNLYYVNQKFCFK